MRKLINGKVIDTSVMESLGHRIIARSHNNNPIGWGEILLAKTGQYYYEIEGGNDIYAPDDDLQLIGGFGDLLDLLSTDDMEVFRTLSSLLDHISKIQTRED